MRCVSAEHSRPKRFKYLSSSSQNCLNRDKYFWPCAEISSGAHLDKRVRAGTFAVKRPHKYISVCREAGKKGERCTLDDLHTAITSLQLRLSVYKTTDKDVFYFSIGVSFFI